MGSMTHAVVEATQMPVGQGSLGHTHEFCSTDNHYAINKAELITAASTSLLTVD